MSAQTVAAVPARRSGRGEFIRVAPTAAVRYAGVAVIALAFAALHLKHRPTSLCLFRSVTGIPCPLCGGTTAAVDLGHGNLQAALLASPFAVGLLGLGPLLSALRAPAWWQVPRHRWWVIGTVLVVSEVWELVRFGIISF